MATRPPEKPLLYRFMLTTGVPVYSTTEEEKPGQHAEGPAEIAGDRGQSGAEQAGKLDRGVAEGPVHHQSAQKHASTMTGMMLKACLPKAEKPMMVSIPPTVGPFRSPPLHRMKAMLIRPLIPVLSSTGLRPNIRRKSLGARPLS